MSYAPLGKIVLLAMPQSGESFFARDEWGDVWLHRPVLGYEPVRASHEDVVVAVTRFDWSVIDREFDSWPDLDAERLRLVDSDVHLTPDTPDFAQYDRRDVELALEEAELIEQSHAEDAVDVLLSLLDECPIVQNETDLRYRVTAALRRTVAPPGYGPINDGAVARALNRMTLPAAAA